MNEESILRALQSGRCIILVPIKVIQIGCEVI